MGYITAIGTATPEHRINQIFIADFMIKAMNLGHDEARKLRAIFRSSGIAFRHSVLEDYGRKDQFTFYANTDDFEPFPSTDKRLKVFCEQALPLSVRAARNAFNLLPGFSPSQITHLIVVCCTGMYAPGLDIDLVKALKLSTNVQRTCVNFMGCYAAFNAVKIAEAFCRSDPSAKVLVVCTELCSLHFQREPTEDNFIANALFADGSAAIIIEAATERHKKMETASFYSDLAIEGENDMTWKIGDFGFEMSLSSYVPDIIKRGIQQLTCSLLNGLQKKLSDIHYYAIHPGGRRILEVIEEELGMKRAQNESAYHVLRNYGNMSSPTVLFVLEDIFRKVTTQDDGRYVLSFAFGPGLTMESMLLKIHTNGHA